MYIPRIILNFFGINLDTEQEQEKKTKESKKGIKKNFKGREISISDGNKKKEFKIKSNLRPVDVANLKEEKGDKVEYNYSKSKPAKVVDKYIHSLILDLPKIIDKGEDAAPLLLNFDDNTTVIAVADGMGGAGGTIYNIDNAKRSGAYLASRAIISIAEGYFVGFKNSGYIIDESTIADIAKDLKYHFDTGLMQIMDKIHQKGNSKLNIKSNLIKRLPTTFNLTYIQEYESKITITNFWAGDSRAYILNSTEGLQQLTDDDLINKGDALENLSNDSPLSNCVHADKTYKINFNYINCDKPQIIFTCTDGAFGYVQTPLHFEYMLLNALINSRDTEEWKENLVEVFKSFQSDDISLSLIVLGYINYDQMRNDFKARYEVLQGDFFKLNKAEEELRKKQAEYEQKLYNNENIKGVLKNMYKRIQDIEYDLDKSIRDDKNLHSDIGKLIFLVDEKIREIEKMKKEIEAKKRDSEDIQRMINEIKNTLERNKTDYNIYKNNNKLFNIDGLKKDFDGLNNGKSIVRQDLWKTYKIKYEKYLKS
jgi:hypothetical protein